MVTSIILSKKAKKDLVTIPNHVALKLQDWVEDVEERGIEAVRKIPGYHDEPLKGPCEGSAVASAKQRVSTSMFTKKSDAIQFLERRTGGPVTLGRFLEAVRLGEELTQRAFAEKLVLSRSHLNDIEKGRKAVSPERAARFAKILGYAQTRFVRLALQDLVNRSGLKLQVDVKAA